MFFYLFSRFILNPRLLLTDLRSEYGGILSLTAAFLAVATSTLAALLVFRTNAGAGSWILGSLLHLVLVLSVGVFYLPVIHLFAEKNLPGSRVSDLLVYSGFVLSPLFLTLPLAFIFLLVPSGWLFYSLALLALWIKIILDFVSGVKINYQLSPGA
ncbi:MAG: hypothetical protein ACYC5N_05885, partial [Endomicrobiales bacterium]